MQAIKIYLDKFVQIDRSYRLLKENLITVIKNHTGVDLFDRDFELKGSIIYLRSHPIVRGEIYLKQALILSDLQARSAAGNRITKII